MHCACRATRICCPQSVSLSRIVFIIYACCKDNRPRPDRRGLRCTHVSFLACFACAVRVLHASIGNTRSKADITSLRSRTEPSLWTCPRTFLVTHRLEFSRDTWSMRIGLAKWSEVHTLRIFTFSANQEYLLHSCSCLCMVNARRSDASSCFVNASSCFVNASACHV